ncbi:MAG: OB-fold nucleic acid binding domain-containing protein [Nanoarchaeota archaeon]|nr:OB-fold nucleic acid binding domain-containing protein [Nanoarchaeota archaeon]
MNINEIQSNQGNITIEAKIISKEEPRTFSKFGKEGRVCNATVADSTGEIALTLWNDDIDKANVGDTIKLENGWCSEFKDQKQVSAGKFGKLEVVTAGK